MKDPQEPPTEFFLTGAKTFLDVDDAVREFTRQVQDRCRDIVRERLQELSSASGIAWREADLREYKEVNNRGAFLGVQTSAGDLGKVYFYLAMYREGGYGALVYLWLRRANIAAELWSQAPEDCRDGNSLVFGPLFREEELQSFEDHLRRAVDAFGTFLRSAGGIQKYV